MKIWKYTLQPAPEQTIQTPEFFHALDVQIQGHEMVLWAMVGGFGGDMSIKFPRKVYIVPTGGTVQHPLTASDHVATVQDGPLVWHVFVRRSYAKD